MHDSPNPKSYPAESENQGKISINRSKTRRRIEDALRKTAKDDQLLTIARILGVKVELE